jgi:NAD(P)-dependent dehydrogenase (short-subunit alcohol dehydrogenase family)
MEPSGVAIITGATGGIGRACVTNFAKGARVLAVDISADALEALAAERRAAGQDIAVLACEITADGAAGTIIAAARAEGTPVALIHAAGVSPALANAERIMMVNFAATRHLAEACFEIAGPGFAAVLIASMAAYIVDLPQGAAQSLFEGTDDDLWARMAAYCPNAEASYAVTKRGVITLCEREAPRWGRKGARINSISPGIIATPMARAELAHNAMMQGLIDACPAGRQGHPDEIAAAAAFLCSEQASFISGIDLLVDGGAVAALRQPSHAAAG